MKIESGQGQEIESDKSTSNTDGRHGPASVPSSAELMSTHGLLNRELQAAIANPSTSEEIYLPSLC